jgi:hypothetical protein
MHVVKMHGIIIAVYLKGVQYSLIIHEVLVAMGLFSCSSAR